MFARLLPITNNVEIGNLTWMAENLNRVTSNSWCYGSDDFNCMKYGRLYTWNAAMKACPAGWRLPTRVDWDNLIQASGDNAGKKLKSNTGWDRSGDGTDDFGFSALPGGVREPNGAFNYSLNGYWWTSTEINAGNAVTKTMDWNLNTVSEYGVDKGRGQSVRCVQ